MKRFLFLNQTFHPDVMATGQYLADVALGLVERGHEVTVLCSRRSYEQPGRTFPPRETWKGIRIIRVGSTGFGKAARWRRAADFASFLFCCALRLSFLPRFDVVVALTSPPLVSVLGAAFSKMRGSRFVYWVMDFNPDEAIAAGWLRQGSIVARLFESLSRFSLRRAARIITLDRFMRDRIVAKGLAPERVSVRPPWSLDASVRFDAEGRGRFRAANRLEGKFVVMYSGNHSPCHSLETLLAAAERLANEPSIIFCFVGGGSEWRRLQQRIERAAPQGAGRVMGGNGSLVGGSYPANLLCLPYQPLEELSASLSAADLHVVVLGDAFVGLVHPCKLYNILSVGAPVLSIGPQVSHISEIGEVARGEVEMFCARHGEVEVVVNHIRHARELAGRNARRPSAVVRSLFSRQAVLPGLLDELEGRSGARDFEPARASLSRPQDRLQERTPLPGPLPFQRGEGEDG